MKTVSDEVQALSRKILEEALGIIRELPEKPQVEKVEIDRMCFNTFRRVNVKVSDALSLNITVCEANK